MGKLSSVDPTLVRVDAKLFFDRSEDEPETIRCYHGNRTRGG